MLQPTHSTTKKQFNGRNMNNETTIQKKDITSSYKQHLQFETNTNNKQHYFMFIYRPATFFITTKS